MVPPENLKNVRFADRLFPGGGELSGLMRAMDWSTTPLGPAEKWPLALRSIVRVLLTSRYAMWMGWGPDLTFLYNDAYSAMSLGAKHPWALGRPSREVWSEIWPEIGPRIEKVLHTGEATWDEALLLFLERSGYPEETFHTFSYSPLADDEGTVRGHFCVVIEDTERVIGNRRLAVLKELASQIATTNRIDDVFAASEKCLAIDSRDLPFTLLYRFEGNRAHLVSRSHVPPGYGGALETVDIEELEKLWSVSLRSEFDAIKVLDANPPADWGSWGKQVSRVFVAPIRQSESSPYGVLIAGANPYRPPDDAYRTFVSLYIGQLAAGLANARAYEEANRRADALAEIDRAKTLFFTNVSHEFRTPLTLILGPVQDLLVEAARLPDEHQEKLAIAYRNCLRLQKLVNALLDFSRIEAGRVQASYEPTDLAVLTRDLAAAFRSLVERAGLSFEVKCDPLTQLAYVDREMWEKIVLNLVSNAFKFTFEGKIEVSLREVAGRIELAVTDTGIGISDEELPRIFDRFHRVEGSRSRTYEGSGIGLALVHELVKMHGGDFQVASKVGRGSTFTVVLPAGDAHLPKERVGVARPQTSSANAATLFVEEAQRWDAGAVRHVSSTPIPAEMLDGDAEVANTPSGARILLADDNADMRGYIKHLLGPEYEIETAADGARALEAARARRPDLVLTDVMMPRLDGFGLLEALRSDAQTKTVPVIMLSARAGEEARIEGLARGADDYLIKPFSARELLGRIRSQLELHRLREQAANEREQLLAREKAARREAEEANRSKDEFLAMLGHELRNPLAPILTALQLMQLRKGGPTERERTIIERQVYHLTRLVDDLLDISRITRGNIRLKKEEVELAVVVAKAIEMTSPLIEERMHYLAVDVPSSGLPVNGDPARLVQAISNLLTNAAKYTEPRGRIWIKGTREESHIELRVRDNGIGMDPGLVSHVFDLFYQGSQRSDRSQGGLGIGLAIVRSLILLHDGSVEALSEGVGKGSEFIVRLPALEAQAQAQVGEHKSLPLHLTDAPAGLRVFIVDDNEDAALLLAEALGEKGHVTKIAFNPVSALDLVREFQPDVILLDIGLPIMDGYELADRIRRIPELRQARLFALTGYGQDSYRAHSVGLGFERHLAKPVEIEVLDALIRTTGNSADV